MIKVAGVETVKGTFVKVRPPQPTALTKGTLERDKPAEGRLNVWGRHCGCETYSPKRGGRVHCFTCHAEFDPITGQQQVNRFWSFTRLRTREETVADGPAPIVYGGPLGWNPTGLTVVDLIRGSQ